jgi:hypothetical protein
MTSAQARRVSVADMRVPIPPVHRAVTSATRLASGAAAGVALGALDGVLASRVFDEGIERISAHVLQSPELERVVAEAIESPATERLVTQVIESRLLEDIVSRLLEREEFWLAIEEIARSPAVTEAITQQSLGFADQVAEGVRTGSSGADAWLERAARRVVRRSRDRGEGSIGGAAPAPAT